ncbi:MAG: hypothetical protein JO043_11485 [Candidatus Eremiobacteraeota bacterium]|nr:hypothetical protein [Candidatus Eremiobacteraeota bacterium]
MLHRPLSAAAAAIIVFGTSLGAALPAHAMISATPVRHQTFMVRRQPQAFKQKYFTMADAVQPTDITLGPKGTALWIGSPCFGILRVTPKGIATAFNYQYPPSGCNYPVSVTPGIKGEVWFVDGPLNAVGAITPKGKITLYPLPTQPSCNIYPSYPNGIVEGPDGAMWFTTQNAGDVLCANANTSAVGRITASGQMTLYYTGPPGTIHTYNPSGYIAVGSDGAMYFPAGDPSSPQHLVVGRITTAGTISFTNEVYCSASTACISNTFGITEGPDGNMWISEYFDGVFVRYTVATGGVTVFPVPGAVGGNTNPIGPRRLVIGPDGGMWFTTYTALELGRLTTDGTITFQPLSVDPSQADEFWGITAVKKSLWFPIWPRNPGNVNLGEATF